MQIFLYPLLNFPMSRSTSTLLPNLPTKESGPMWPILPNLLLNPQRCWLELHGPPAQLLTCQGCWIWSLGPPSLLPTCQWSQLWPPAAPCSPLHPCKMTALWRYTTILWKSTGRSTMKWLMQCLGVTFNQIIVTFLSLLKSRYIKPFFNPTYHDY